MSLGNLEQLRIKCDRFKSNRFWYIESNRIKVDRVVTWTSTFDKERFSTVSGFTRSCETIVLRGVIPILR